MKTKNELIHDIVEYIKGVGVWFDAADVEEDIEDVVRQYGFSGCLSARDLAILRQDLFPLGLAAEVAEVSRLVAQEKDGPSWAAHLRAGYLPSRTGENLLLRVGRGGWRGAGGWRCPQGRAAQPAHRR